MFARLLPTCTSLRTAGSPLLDEEEEDMSIGCVARRVHSLGTALVCRRSGGREGGAAREQPNRRWLRHARRTINPSEAGGKCLASIPFLLGHVCFAPSRVSCVGRRARVFDLRDGHMGGPIQSHAPTAAASTTRTTRHTRIARRQDRSLAYSCGVRSPCCLRVSVVVSVAPQPSHRRRRPHRRLAAASSFMESSSTCRTSSHTSDHSGKEASERSCT